MKEKTKIIIAILISLFCDLLIVLFLVAPAFGAIKQASFELLYYKKKLAQIKGEVANFQDFEAHHQLYLQNLQEMNALVENQLFIDKEVPLELVSFCQEEASRENLQFEITPLRISSQEESSQEGEKPPFDFLILRIKLEGKFPNLLRFIKRLESSQWLIQIQQINISKQEETVEANLLIRAYAKDRHQKES